MSLGMGLGLAAWNTLTAIMRGLARGTRGRARTRDTVESVRSHQSRDSIFLSVGSIMESSQCLLVNRPSRLPDGTQ